jgi:sigma-B regulation protein RsbU (phosphoserine phosphatase)
MFVTMFYGILNTRTGELRYANGGHNPPYVFSREGQIRELPADKNGMIVGLMDGAVYQTASHTIAPGEGLMIYTDGVTEAMDRREDFYGEERLEALLVQHGAMPVDRLVAQLMASVEEFAAGTPQSDDITVLAMRYLGN